MPLDGSDVLVRLVGQLHESGADDVHVLSAGGAAVAGALMHDCPDTGAALEELAALIPPGRPVVLVAGDILLHLGALQMVADDGRVETCALVGPRTLGEPVLARDGRVEISRADRPDELPSAGHLSVLLVAERGLDVLPASIRAVRESLVEEPTDDPAVVVRRLTEVLVGTGGRVAAVPLGGYCWARPRTLPELSEALVALAAVDEERVRLDASVKADDSPFTAFLVSPWSKHLTRWAARLGRTPNQVTMASLLVAVAAALACATGDRIGYVAGAVLLQLSFGLDCVDGQLARFTRRFSAAGAWLDAVFDRTKEYAVYAGLAVGAGGEGVWVLAAAAMGMQTIKHTTDLSFRFRPVGGAHAATSSDRGRTESRRGGPVRSASAAVTWLSVRTSRVAALRWAKMSTNLPIGERWALISLLTAVSVPRVTLAVLVVLGGITYLYTLGLRFVGVLARG